MSNYKFNPSTGEFEDKKNWGNYYDQSVGLWGLIFLLFPIIGFIVYFFYKDNKPNKAKSILNWSIAGLVFTIIVLLND